MNRRPFANSRQATVEVRAQKREALRRSLFEEQGGLCWLCGRLMTLERGKYGKPGRNFASFDHVVPKAVGGTTHHTNLKLAHRKCNSARNHRPAEIGNGSRR